MFDKLDSAEEKFEEISEKLGQPEVLADQELFKDLMREHKSMSALVEKYREYKSACRNEREAREIIDAKPDRELREMADEELSKARTDIARLTAELNILLLPRDKNDDKNVIVEIRGGAGGEEAALFAASLYRMYSMYAEHRGWKTEVLNLNGTELGGIKEISFMIEGEGAYSRLKYESGVHRVQRVPETETSGRIHTSTVTVAVLPEVEDVEVQINPNDLRIDTYHSSGAGGQHINKTSSAIRITHLPTGLVVECQDERSQYKNKDKAMRVLRSRLYDQAQGEQDEKIAAKRRSQVGTGDRSERIRTYNFPQGRVTDHRIGLTLYKIDAVLDGGLDEIIDPLITADRTEKLKNGESRQHMENSN
jgi:peptide chain release factor 1